MACPATVLKNNLDYGENSRAIPLGQPEKSELCGNQDILLHLSSLTGKAFPLIPQSLMRVTSPPSRFSAIGMYGLQGSPRGGGEIERNSVSWPQPTCEETGKCQDLCAQEEHTRGSLCGELTGQPAAFSRDGFLFTEHPVVRGGLPVPLCSSHVEPTGAQDLKPVCLALPVFKARGIQAVKARAPSLGVSGVWNLLNEP